MMSTQLTTTQSQGQTILEVAGQVANKHAQTAVFDDYLSRKSDNTIKTQQAALMTFADYLAAAGVYAALPTDEKERRAALTKIAKRLQTRPEEWRGVTWGMTEAFVRWMLAQGFAIKTVNNRLSAVKTYAKLAAKAGVIDASQLALIKTVSGYSGKEGKRIDERRDVTRVGDKKAQHVSLTPEEAQRLRRRDLESPQGRRDALLMGLLLEHGLRLGEVAGLQVTDFDLKRGELKFYRSKVDKTQTHKLETDTLKAARAYFEHDAPAMGRAILGSAKGGALTGKPMGARAITKRVEYLARVLVGKRGVSAHDCRHHWTTSALRGGTDALHLQEAGGWSSLAMVVLYKEAAKIANQGVKLSA